MFLQVTPGRDFEALWTLRALIAGHQPDPEQVLADTGLALSVWQDLVERMKQARFGVMFFGTGLALTRGRHLNTEALLAVVRDMNAHTRFVAKAMRAGGNVAGADNVLAWRTGYAFAVNLSHGYPRFNPGEYTANEILTRHETDAVLLVGCDMDEDLTPAARQDLAGVPHIVVGYRPTAEAVSATVAFQTSTPGIHTGGTVYRMDEIPLPLRPAVASALPSELDVLTAIERRAARAAGRRRRRAMTSSLTKIAGGTVYDPTNGIDGQVRDLWIDDGKIVSAPTDPAVRPDRTIDARGLVVMPGGIDMHCHIAGPKVNVARKMRPEEKRAGRAGHAHGAPRTAARWAASPARLPPATSTPAWATPRRSTPPFRRSAARHAHEEFADTPCIDKGFYVLMGNNHYVMQAIQRQGAGAAARRSSPGCLAATKGYAPKLVNPGGVEVWKQQQAGNVSGLRFGRRPLRRHAAADHSRHRPGGRRARLPHPVHIHCNNLGMPGNWTTTLETMKAPRKASAGT